MKPSEADKVELSEIVGIEEGASGIRVTWKNNEREFFDGAVASRLLARWRGRMDQRLKEQEKSG